MRSLPGLTQWMNDFRKATDDALACAAEKHANDSCEQPSNQGGAELGVGFSHLSRRSGGTSKERRQAGQKLGGGARVPTKCGEHASTEGRVEACEHGGRDETVRPTRVDPDRAQEVVD